MACLRSQVQIPDQDYDIDRLEVEIDWLIDWSNHFIVGTLKLIVYQVYFLDNSHISKPSLELHSRAAPSVRGIITAQSVLTQGKIPEEGRKKMRGKMADGLSRH